jgi:hypothetical protein
MYRPPFRQVRPHIAAGVAADKFAKSVGIGVPIKACALFKPSTDVSAAV